MEHCWVLCFLACLISSSAEGQSFRSDYVYNDDVGAWFKLHRVPSTWKEAALTCYYEGATIASPLDAKFQNVFKMLALENGLVFQSVYTGISSSYFPGVFYSMEGISLESRIPFEWGPFDDTGSNGEARCIITNAFDEKLKTTNCLTPYPYVCYRKKTKFVQTSDCGTVDQAYVFDNRTGSCYKFHHVAQTWSRAYMICAAEGGQLAIINSQVEAQVLRELIDRAPEKKITSLNVAAISIGFRDWGEHNIWLTLKGESLEEAGYADWAPGEPNGAPYDAKDGENCGSILRTTKAGLLNDVRCNIALAFICEMTPKYLSSIKPMRN